MSYFLCSWAVRRPSSIAYRSFLVLHLFYFAIITPFQTSGLRFAGLRQRWDLLRRRSAVVVSVPSSTIRRGSVLVCDEASEGAVSSFYFRPVRNRQCGFISFPSAAAIVLAGIRAFSFSRVTQHVDRLDLIPMFLFSLEVFRLGSGS